MEAAYCWVEKFLKDYDAIKIYTNNFTDTGGCGGGDEKVLDFILHVYPLVSSKDLFAEVYPCAENVCGAVEKICRAREWVERFFLVTVDSGKPAVPIFFSTYSKKRCEKYEKIELSKKSLYIFLNILLMAGFFSVTIIILIIKTT